MSGGDPEFSRAFVAAFDRLPTWQQDQIQAHFRDAIPVIQRICDLMERFDLMDDQP